MKNKLEQLTNKISDIIPDLQKFKYEKVFLKKDEEGNEIISHTLEHKVQLADVLSAFIEKDNKLKVYSNSVIFGCNEISKMFDYWDLTQPLHLQSEKTINYLHDIICN